MVRRKLLALALAVLTMVAIGVAYKIAAGPGPEGEARHFAEQAARAIAAGRVPAPLATQNERDAQKSLDTTLKGMGSLQHQVSVTDVEVIDGTNQGTVTLAHRWIIHKGKAPWTYTTTLPIVWRDDRWTAQWANSALAPDLSDTDRLAATRIPATRGGILGDDGSPLVTERKVVRIGIERSRVPDAIQAKESAARLAELTGLDPDTYATSVGGSGPQAFVEAIVYRDPSTDLESIAPRLGAIPGAVAIVDTLPLPPNTGFADPILGRVGAATAEIVTKSKGAVRAGDTVGLTGLQATQNARLAGEPGFTVQALSTTGGSPVNLFTVRATTGTPVKTTLLQAVQEAAERALRAVTPASAIVAIRPSDGHVLAAANGPGSKGYATATLGQYAPGSTFKTITSLALLRTGLNPRTPVDCTATTTVDGRIFKNYDNYSPVDLGRIPLRAAIAHSCNTGLIAARGKLGPASLADAAAAVGLTADPALGVPASLGKVPNTNGDTDLAASTIGQGRITTTPLGMATAAASIAAGRPVRPVLVTEPATPTTPTAPPKPITPAEADQVRSLMRAVVTEGSAPFLRDIPGGPVMAKTGTAEYGNDTPPRTHAWMIAIQGDLAVAVFVEDGSGGAHTAGPILEAFLRDLERTP